MGSTRNVDPAVDRRRQPMRLLDYFNSGMKQQVAEFIEPPDGPQVNLGAGSHILPGVDNLDRSSGWKAPLLPYDDDSVAAIYAFHFMEHLPGDVVIAQLKEIERVLMRDGILVTVTPHWSCELAHQDLDHKSFWSESTYRNLMINPHYSGSERSPDRWNLILLSSMIMGVVDRNLVVVSQLVKAR